MSHSTNCNYAKVEYYKLKKGDSVSPPFLVFVIASYWNTTFIVETIPLDDVALTM